MNSKSKIIFLIGRDNWQQDDTLNHVLIEYLKKTKHEIRWEDPAGDILYKLRRFESNTIIARILTQLSFILRTKNHFENLLRQLKPIAALLDFGIIFNHIIAPIGNSLQQRNKCFSKLSQRVLNF